MDGARFDALARALGGTRSRRGSVRLMAGAAVLGARALLSPGITAAGCKKPGKPCDKDNDCCSKKCKQGKCRCSKAGKPCAGNADCCGVLVCDDDGHCGPDICSAVVGEACDRDSDCCVDTGGCQAPSGGGPKRCCQGQGEFCFSGNDDDCCGGLICDSADTYTCVIPGGLYTCRPLGDDCHDSDQCCDGLACCGLGCCGDVGCPVEDKRCCGLPGERCQSDGDCCFGLGGGAECEAGFGGEQRCCLPEGEYCSQDHGCCQGLVCDLDGSHKCVELGVGT